MYYPKHLGLKKKRTKREKLHMKGNFIRHFLFPGFSATHWLLKTDLQSKLGGMYPELMKVPVLKFLTFPRLSNSSTDLETNTKTKSLVLLS